MHRRVVPRVPRRKQPKRSLPLLVLWAAVRFLPSFRRLLSWAVGSEGVAAVGEVAVDLGAVVAADAVGGGRGGAGGRGGRGGAAGGSAATPMATDMTAAQASDAAAKAIAAVTREPRNEPVILTFIALDSQDYAKLIASLDGARATNQRDLTAAAVRDRSNGAALGSAPSGNASNLNNSNQLYKDQTNDPQSQRQNGSNSAAANSPANTALPDAFSPASYHLALTAAELNNLANQYRIAVLARGSDLYLFHTVGTQTPATADAKARADLLKSFGYSETDALRPGSTALSSATAPGEAAGLVPSPAAVNPTAAASKQRRYGGLYYHHRACA